MDLLGLKGQVSHITSFVSELFVKLAFHLVRYLFIVQHFCDTPISFFDDWESPCGLDGPATVGCIGSNLRKVWQPLYHPPIKILGFGLHGFKFVIVFTTAPIYWLLLNLIPRDVMLLYYSVLLFYLWYHYALIWRYYTIKMGLLKMDKCSGYWVIANKVKGKSYRTVVRLAMWSEYWTVQHILKMCCRDANG